jgi:hypothetical protein
VMAQRHGDHVDDIGLIVDHEDSNLLGVRAHVYDCPPGV